ncbi:MAG: translocation/assembly module TamB [Tannerella sp.]|nr:translocation/assembly module TamB [Tannerella sp.]
MCSIFYTIPTLLLQVPFIQDKLATEATRELSKQLNVPVRIGGVTVDWLNRLVLKDVFVEDQQGEVLLEADHLSAGFKLFPLLEKRWVFTTVRLFGLSIHLRQENPESELNLKFLLDAFSSKDTTKTSYIDLQINSALIRRGSLKYHVASIPDNQEKFSSKHIELNNINANIAIKSLSPDSLNAQIKKCSFDERTGFKLNKLSVSLEGNKDSVSLQNLQVQLPNSLFELKEATILHSGLDSLDQIFDKAPLRLQIIPSRICLRDFSAFAPVLKNYSDCIQLSASVSGTINDLLLEELSLKQNGTISLLAKMNLRSITRPDETYLFGQVSNFHASSEGLLHLINNFQKESVNIPSYFANLGSLDFNGEISGFLDHLVAYGNLRSDIGSLKMDLLIGQKKKENIANYFKGQVESSELNLHALFDEGNPYGIAHFRIDVDVSRPVNGSFAGDINAQINQFDYKEYHYENILLDGKFRKDEFNGMFFMDDPNGKLYAEGLFKNSGKNSEFNFFAKLGDFRPDKFFLTDKYEDPELNLSLNVNFTGNNVDDFAGHITVDSLSFLTLTDSFYLDTLHIETLGMKSNRKLTVTSDIINGEVIGNYSFRSLIPSFLETARIYLPSLPVTESKRENENIFSLTAKIENTENLSNTFQLPFTIIDPIQIYGQYNSIEDQLSFEAILPKFKIGKSVFESGSVLCHNPDGKLQFQTTMTLLHSKGSRNQFSIHADAKNDQINTLLHFENDRDEKMKIDLLASSLFIMEKDESGKDRLRTEITIEPEQIILKDSIWELEPSSITVVDGNVIIDNFYLSKNDQYLRINGTASAKKPNETICLDLNDIELSYIFDIVNIPALQFGGRATGTVNLSDLYGNRILNTDLEVQNFSFNQVVQGRLSLFSEWDNDQQGILMLGTVYKNDTTWTDVNGYIYPVGKNAGLSLYFDATDIDLALLHPYVDAFSNVIEGRGYGNIHLYGAFSKLSFEGKAFIRDGRIGVDFLNTDYTFSDSVYVYPTSFQGNNIAIVDKDGNRGLVNFNVQHQFLKEFNFQVDVQANNLLIYNAPEKINPQIYGVVYGSGNAQIKGDDRIIDIDANLKTEPHTSIGFNFMANSTVENYDFILFRDQLVADQTKVVNREIRPILTANNRNTEIRLNCLVDATPDASFELIMDPAGGDKIKGNGNGNLQVQYGSKGNLSMYGAYTLLYGTYNFSLQQVIHKDFQIREGSRIDFSGDPMNAILDINASYYLTANIEDLDQTLVHETVRTSIPINCILMLDGPIQNPLISFDLEFPSSSQELERQVKSFIDTEDMMLRQIIYLLVLNKFYTPDYSRNEYRTSEFNSIASSALSSQLSSILNSLSDKVQIGANIRSGQEGFTDTEVEMLLSSQLLNNRLIFNGSFGYKNNVSGSSKDNLVQSNAFIGEFDLEYKLTPTGEYRLKAYNHANDKYLYSRSLTRQGVGVMFRKDFSTLRELFIRRKRYILSTDTIESE